MFTQNTFTPVSSHGNSDSPNSWSYRTEDTQAEVSAEDYFIKKYPVLNHGDFISVASSDAIFSATFIESQGKFTLADLNSGVAQLNVEQVLLGRFSTAAPQNPTGRGASGSIVINYGVGGSTSGGEFDIDAGGVVTCNMNSIQYDFEVTLRIDRTGGGGNSEIMARMMYAENGVDFVQSGGTFNVRIDDDDTVWREGVSLKFSPAVGSKIYIELARDESGSNSGGLGATQPSGTLSGWNPVGVATLDILKTITVIA